ncbi:glycoside hydrolase family 18 protein [Heterobasidion irregulare TC 32-1]|uniref:chitinase n=1 Tax=Heterobasidion irregulare (strain TC 32-1) TaxID=747525 RepID=W4JPM8_HETIT|nr:glycoside hydrolase family 18 protein [Heterobasidion irregulare TC 32-1]ETW75424.1 glycoside hydrolase family 18 protein [Heterobasidion irregulare TC 32-1]
MAIHSRPRIFTRLALLVAAVLAATSVVDATQVMHRPVNYKFRPEEFHAASIEPQIVERSASTGKVQAAYFTNWGIYGANFQPTDILPADLTHILYSFADVTPSTGSIFLTDSYADEQKHFPGDSWSEPGNNLYGCLKQLYLLKLANRNLKVLLSVGGWTYSQAGHFSFVTDAGLRQTFVSSAVQLIEDYGFDGIDLDFEYPANAAQGQGFANLYTSLRTALDALAAKKGDATTYQLTSAVSAGADNYANLVVGQMDKALSYWNLMAYDYAGSWLSWSDNQANLYGGARTGVNTDSAVKWFTSQGATAGKINMGIPLYGRGFEQTAGLGQPYNGVGSGTTESGIWSYKDLPLAGAQVIENTTDVSSYSYDSAKQELISYDTPHIVQLKAQYVMNKGLAGSMFWDLSTDKVGTDSLVGTSSGVYGPGNLDQTANHINYPNSKWDNIRSNMGQSPSSPGTTTSAGSTTATSTTSKSTSTSTTSPATTTTPPTTSAPATTSKPATTTAPSSGACAGVAAWDSTVAYTGGLKVTYKGHLWTAKWWTEADTPGGSADVWTDSGAC